MGKLLIVAALLFAAGCKKEKQCSVSVGACQSPQGSCGVSLACGDRQLEIRCTAPSDPSAKQMDCQCIENGVIGKSVQLVYPLSAPSAESLAKTACGWK